MTCRYCIAYGAEDCEMCSSSHPAKPNISPAMKEDLAQIESRTLAKLRHPATKYQDGQIKNVRRLFPPPTGE